MNLKGGYIILSLLALALAPTEEATAITNEEILKQLLSLSDYALHPEKELKPIYLRALDSNGVEVVSLCELERNNGVLRIKAFIMDSVLTIYVAYDIDEETQEVLIDSASYEYVSEYDKVASIIGEGDIENAKPIFWHTVKFERQGDSVYYFEGTMIILNNSEDPITLNDFINLLKINGFYGVVINGLFEQTSGATGPSSSSTPLVAIAYLDGTSCTIYTRNSNNQTSSTAVGITADQWTITDLGANKLN